MVAGVVVVEVVDVVVGAEMEKQKKQSFINCWLLSWPHFTDSLCFDKLVHLKMQ